MANLPLLFDVDGVILRHHRSGPSVYESAIGDAFAEFDVSTTDAEHRSFVGDVSADRMREICRRHGLELPDVWPVRERHVSEHQRELCRNGERTLFDDVDVLSELAASHPIGFVSNNQQATIDFAVDHFGLESVVETAYGREPTWDGFERRKPDPYYIEQALADLGGETGLYVGDRVTDIQAAHRADLTAVYLRRTEADSTSAAVRPDAIIRSLNDIPAVIERLA
ncbi:HAD family hydrolase [Natronorubrum sp. DTA28]|uniref:HAD family hydrolase n=1 Tax=Natronorubrum sp. DTA28 TaxID=3447019 RepID=UPI003F834178